MPALADLVALFCGEYDDWGELLSEPFPTVPLAVEICRKVRPATMVELVQTVYGDTPVDQLDPAQWRMLSAGFERWGRARKAEPAGRRL